MEGADLARRMKAGEHFSNEQLVKWWNDLVDALQYTHRKNIIHRDIKPANLFITETGDIKLLDFGVAKLKDNITVTQTGSRMGTLMYMSPEQVYDVKNLTYKTDNYSLAVTFYHLVSGRAPYDSTKISDFEIQESIVRKSIDTAILGQPWRELLPGYFNKDPQQRKELHQIDNGSVADTAETMYINPVNVVESTKMDDVYNNPTYQYPQPKNKSAFYILFPIAVVLGLMAYALNKDKINGFFTSGQKEVKEAVVPKPQKKPQPKVTKPVEKPLPVNPDTIISNGTDGSIDQVIVNSNPVQREEDAKQFINNYYRSRSNCANLSNFFNNVVTQYYNKSNVSLADVKKECEAYKWKIIEADIDDNSWVFTHNQNGKLYIDFNMLYKIKQKEEDEWIPYNIDVAMVIDEGGKIERVVERRIEKL